MLQPGEQAPDFTLLDQHGQPHTLSAYKGKKVVLYFYPKDNTPGCTTQACSFRDSYTHIQQSGGVVLGVSPDSTQSHKKFADKYTLSFPLLADTDRSVCQLYGVWDKRSLYGRIFMGVKRTTFIIDEQGVIAHLFENVKVKDHDKQILQKLSIG